MKLDDSCLQIIQHLDNEPVNPHELFNSNGFNFSRATFYRRLEGLKQAGLIEWRVGKAKLTEKGLIIRSLLNGDPIPKQYPKYSEGKEEERRTFEMLEKSFRLFEANELKKSIDNGFIYVDYPQTSFILNILMNIARIKRRLKLRKVQTSQRSGFQC